MALSERFFQQKPLAWDLLAPLVELTDPPGGYDPDVGSSIYEFYREADRDSGAEKASSALVSYLHAAYSAGRIESLSPEKRLEVSYFATGFFLHVANSLDSLALWMADACKFMQSSRARPSLTADDFLARVALIDAAARVRLRSERAWLEEAQAYAWFARSKNSLLWTGESGAVVISSTTIRGSEAAQLGDVSIRSSNPTPATELCKNYLTRLRTILGLVFQAGAPKLVGKSSD